ncbi:hypothetical protein BGLA2_2350013 [Burkholderia gladioli]|nr:hypothetical protein BGLA2_2350013 [Burkholderia gladioli]
MANRRRIGWRACPVVPARFRVTASHELLSNPHQWVSLQNTVRVSTGAIRRPRRARTNLRDAYRRAQRQ